MKFFFGFSFWKHKFMKPYFKNDELLFINPLFKKNYLKLALKNGLDKNASIYIWGKKSFPLVEDFVKKHNLKLFRVEDGFIRSVGLGSDLTQAYSLVVDSCGIYFDPTQESDLENILNTTSFDEELLQKAKRLKEYLLDKKLSKYNLYENKKLQLLTEKKILLVPGQVEDDASIKYGAKGMTNLELLKKTRINSPDAYIIYKPHPDVLVGNRVGHIDEEEALLFADVVLTTVGLDSVLEVCHEVHTMTSLVGFEALMRGKKVHTYGMPFYAGWGLTEDITPCKRRVQKLSIDALVAGTMLLYPKYIDPDTLEFCEAEQLLESLDEKKKLYDKSLKHRIKLKLRNFFSRKSQLFLRIITLKN